MPFCVYRCSKCRREFETSEGATACEESHLFPETVRIARYSIGPYPIMIQVGFRDGSIHEYRIDEQ